MIAVEFRSKIVNNRIEIPDDLRDRFQGEVSVIVFGNGTGADESGWPPHNRRRWELIVRKLKHGLTASEEQELATLQLRADEELARVGTRPTEELERWYAELSQEG